MLKDFFSIIAYSTLRVANPADYPVIVEQDDATLNRIARKIGMMPMLPDHPNTDSSDWRDYRRAMS